MNIGQSQQESLADLVDRIVELRHSLLPTCQDTSALPSEERRIVKSVCQALQSVTAELTDILRPVAAADVATLHTSSRDSSKAL